ncbi:MAG TPA: hypothetical protein ENJ26_02200 [Rhodobacteraceae bacterium]|nr:hypothetical protein [Paracoccaceae bacterium]
MTRGAFGFHVARLRRDETALSAWSGSRRALVQELTGRHVAIVGNACALAQTENGARIDASDLVVRINRAPRPAAVSHGTRTDWLALAVKLRKPEGDRIAPRRILWLSPKRKRLPFWVASRPGFYLYPLDEFARLQEKLGAPPTTGLMMIDLVARSEARKIDLFGFDFFSSLSLTGSRTAAQVPHDFGAEKAWVEDLVARDRRIAIN